MPVSFDGRHLIGAFQGLASSPGAPLNLPALLIITWAVCVVVLVVVAIVWLRSQTMATTTSTTTHTAQVMIRSAGRFSGAPGEDARPWKAPIRWRPSNDTGMNLASTSAQPDVRGRGVRKSRDPRRRGDWRRGLRL